MLRSLSEPISFPILPSFILVALALGGCTTDNNYPSLAPRPIENISIADPVAPPKPAGTPSAVAATRYAPTIEKARVADGDFRHVLGEEREAMRAGRGAGEGSDTWLAGQEALSRVEAARSPVIAALSDLDSARSADEPRTDNGIAVAVAQAYDAVHAIDVSERKAIAEAWPEN